MRLEIVPLPFRECLSREAGARPGGNMSFIDRLLQSRRIVTKVLLFVVPLVLLIAGVGLAGYYTANMLNGHMTVTRATIENIGDFENLQAVLQDFTSTPNENSLATLRAGIERQSKGVARLDSLLVTEGDRGRIAAVSGLGETLSRDVDGLWAVVGQRFIPGVSDALASYAFGAFGVPLWQMAVGAFIGSVPRAFVLRGSRRGTAGAAGAASGGGCPADASARVGGG